ncbi:LysR family transcriptional regulator [Candidatus Nitrotoga sp. 1052]|uniref:LysR family transcriptional regulator n=1 Tax=Candidatus Nitrotoga sp. 1052 TaxID=2886964 RepID=UPI001F9FEECC|nr:LysR family transcriptional regulator [Candidatus Nitrotoga sp. 1052]CAH1082965.1 DNA-binding transcriptional dual regulator MetR [Candidatus Nitrotoga sp. 1052]
MLSILELRHLRMLEALVGSGNLSRAAQRLHLTQSAISHQVKQIEDHYGVLLFERKTQPLRLTAAGQRLHALAEGVLAQVAEAERDIARIVEGQAGRLRVAVECHTCFEWLMPAMDVFREHWPEVELDLVSGFHVDPLALLREDRADLAVVSEYRKNGMTYHPLFGFEIVGIVSCLHKLAQKEYLTARDFADETLVTYPVPEEMLDVIRNFLKPHGVEPKRRTAELTVAILQLVASRRGISAMPNWAVQSYLKTGYVQGMRLGKEGLFGELYAVTHVEAAQAAYMQDFLETVRTVSFNRLPGLIPLMIRGDEV